METKTIIVESHTKLGARRKGKLVELEGRYRAVRIIEPRGRWEFTLREDDPLVLPVPAVLHTSHDGRIRVVRIVDDESGEDRLVLERRFRQDAMGAPAWVLVDNAPPDVVQALLALVSQKDAPRCRHGNCRQSVLPAGGMVAMAPATGAFCRAHELILQTDLALQDGYSARHDVVVVMEDELARQIEVPQRCARCGSGAHQLQACPEELPPEGT